MFGHIFTYRFKLLLRDRSSLFWTFLYPMILAFFFTMAFSNLTNAAAFKIIPIAVVDNSELSTQTAFKGVLQSVSDDNAASRHKYFHVMTTSKEEAEKSLRNNAVKGYILFDGGAHIVVKGTGFEQTFIKEFMDSVLQYGSAYQFIARQNPAAAASFGTQAEKNYLESVAPGRANTSQIVISYYGLLAMSAMFGGFWGRREVEDIQANLSPQGMRMNLIPVHKLKAFASSISAAVIIHFLVLAVLVAFMALALNVNFGSNLVYILITCFFASLMGVTFGALIAALVKTSSQLRIAVMLSVSLILSSVAGMINPSLKYAVTNAMPILAYINPANLISDAFYALFYYGMSTRYLINIALMLAFSAVFSFIVYVATRRQKYVSL